tara:strand:- start:11924 stop:13015 length:1092 start_codon:yes stop_codon:yes gene_type:complete
MIKKKILIATGGTGGHVIPACALANFLIKQNFSVKLTIDKRGQKYLGNDKNFDLVKISSSPLIKTNTFKFFNSILINFVSIFKSLLFLLFNRPVIVFGMGGYSSFPICVAASILKIKFIVYENNLIIGKANKYLLPLAKKIFVSYKELEGINEKYQDKVVEIGNIIREEMINFDISMQKNTLENMNILVLGGSQAAKVFAEELPKIFEKLKNSKITFKVFQQCQKEQNDQLSNFYKNSGIDFEIFNFSDNIINYYSKANLVITRSGASVLGELINVKTPFISIPLPTSADNHQYKNAEFYLKKGYGYLLEEKDIKYKLYDLLYSILKDNSPLKKILSNQKQYSDRNIFKNLKNQLEKILNEEN